MERVLKRIKVKLCSETVQSIEKAASHRAREGYFGADYSAIARYEGDYTSALRKSHLTALVNGDRAYSVYRDTTSTELFNRLSENSDIATAKNKVRGTQFGRTDGDFRPKSAAGH